MSNPIVSRRELLARCGTGLGVLGLAGLLADSGELIADAPTWNNPLAPKSPHFPARAKHIIHVYLNGGPSQVDTFDPKPALEKFKGQRPASIDGLKTENNTQGLRPSPFKFERHGQAGIPVSEIFPELATCGDDLCVIRSMHTNVPNHEPSNFMMNSGHVQSIRPSYGSWLLYGLGTENQNLPGYVVLGPGLPVNGAANWSNRFLPGIYQGCHIDLKPGYNPQAVIPDLANGAISTEAQRRQLDLIQKMNEMQAERRGHEALLDARIGSFEMAFRMQASAPEAFDITREPAPIHDLYGINRGGNDGIFAMNCLLARRLVERGVRCVQIYFGTWQPWDTHDRNDEQHRTLARTADRPVAALLKDLKQRGLLEETIVMLGGEFGRTPAAQGNGRDHNHWGFSTVLAGGGFKGGVTYGATDEFGFKAEDKRVHVHDLHATLLHLMGLDHEKLTYRYSGRDFRLTDVEGVVVKDILA
jgi:hypothetical protein